MWDAVKHIGHVFLSFLSDPNGSWIATKAKSNILRQVSCFNLSHEWIVFHVTWMLENHLNDSVHFRDLTETEAMH